MATDIVLSSWWTFAVALAAVFATLVGVIYRSQSGSGVLGGIWVGGSMWAGIVVFSVFVTSVASDSPPVDPAAKVMMALSAIGLAWIWWTRR